jgi:hypothetical protein
VSALKRADEIIALSKAIAEERPDALGITKLIGALVQKHLDEYDEQTVAKLHVRPRMGGIEDYLQAAEARAEAGGSDPLATALKWVCKELRGRIETIGPSRGQNIILRSGRQLYLHGLIPEMLDDAYWGDRPLTPDERHEIADEMIARWKSWREGSG